MSRRVSDLHSLAQRDTTSSHSSGYFQLPPFGHEEGPPGFDGVGDDVSDWLEKFEMITNEVYGLSNEEKCEVSIRYWTNNESLFLETLPDFQNRNWARLRSTLLDLYPSPLRTLPPPAEQLKQFIADSRWRLTMSREDFEEYDRIFLGIAIDLEERGVIRRETADLLYWIGLPLIWREGIGGELEEERGIQFSMEEPFDRDRVWSAAMKALYWDEGCRLREGEWDEGVSEGTEQQQQLYDYRHGFELLEEEGYLNLQESYLVESNSIPEHQFHDASPVTLLVSSRPSPSQFFSIEDLPSSYETSEGLNDADEYQRWLRDGEEEQWERRQESFRGLSHEEEEEEEEVSRVGEMLRELEGLDVRDPGYPELFVFLVNLPVDPRLLSHLRAPPELLRLREENQSSRISQFDYETMDSEYADKAVSEWEHGDDEEEEVEEVEEEGGFDELKLGWEEAGAKGIEHEGRDGVLLTAGAVEGREVARDMDWLARQKEEEVLGRLSPGV
ncbi:hypothetical protein BDY24DRAFT_444004 [Mrakia frigida]|uniref:uncharacterized protein n=1 Tax=Mrakia frigida TaxID=29902 RepID=UPI003FCC152D